jgi:general secretion pathway protein C
MGALALGGWISLQIWPHWIDFRDQQPPKPDVPSTTQPAFVPAPAPDKQTSYLGTDSSISEKPLQLVLVATSPASSLADGTATLGTDPRNPQTYAGGALLANGARIDEIHADRIVLSRNGRRETLVVDREAVSRVAMNASINEQRAAKGLEILTPTLAEGKAGSLTSVGGMDAGRQEKAATSREDLSAILRPQPVFENDKFIGLRILPGTSPGRLAALGMEAGDVIRTVEGKLIESDAAWQAIDDALSAGDSIVVGIERNGSLMSVSLDGSRLSATAPIG